MSATSPLPEAVLARAAELRAEGSGWHAVADELGHADPAELRRLCQACPDFDRLLRRAWAAVVRDGLAEAVFTFRRLMRTGDDRTARLAAEGMRRAADALARDRAARLRLRLRHAPKAREVFPDDPEKWFPPTPAGREARSDYLRGRAAREDEESRTPEQEAAEQAEADERWFAEECHRRGYAALGRRFRTGTGRGTSTTGGAPGWT